MFLPLSLGIIRFSAPLPLVSSAPWVESNSAGGEGRIEFCRGGQKRKKGGQNFFSRVCPPLFFLAPPTQFFYAPAKINPAHATDFFKIWFIKFLSIIGKNNIGGSKMQNLTFFMECPQGVSKNSFKGFRNDLMSFKKEISILSHKVKKLQAWQFLQICLSEKVIYFFKFLNLF